MMSLLWSSVFVSLFVSFQLLLLLSLSSSSSYQCEAQIATTSFYTNNAFNYTDKATFTLDIIHTAQFFGRIGPVTVNGSNVGTECTLAETKNNVPYCSSASGQSGGGIARLQTFISNARTSYANNNKWSKNAGKPLLIDAGNMFFGGPVYNALQLEPYVDLVDELGVDIMGMGLYEFIETAQKTRDWVDAINPEIPIVVSNINAAGDEFLGSPRVGLTAAQSESGRTTKFESYRVLNISVNGGTDVIPVGFVGCLLETTNSAGAVSLKVTIETDPEPSVRLAIQRLVHAYPSVNVIVMISSCSVEVNERLARNIIELDVIVETGVHYSNNPADRGNGKYPKVITNNLGGQSLIVAAGAYGARVGHLAVQFDKQGNTISWLGDTTLLTSSIPADPTALSLVTSYLSRTVDFENRVIGTSVHDVEGDDCRNNDCAAGELTCDALLWYCKDCVVAFQNGGGYGATAGLFTAAKGGNVTVNDLYRLSRFSNTISTFYVTGTVMLKVLQVGLQLNSIMQVAGMRYAYNPDSSLPIAQRIIDVEIYSAFAKKYVSLNPTQLYKVASSDFIALGGGSHTELQNGGAQQLNRYGPMLREVYRQYIAANSPINGTTKANLLPCNNATYVLNYTNGQIVWPNEGCRIVRSSGSQDLLKVCPTSSKYAVGDVVYEGMIAGMTIINSSINTCSGLGTCANQKCTCAVATEGMYAGLIMIRGDDCSDVRREYKFSSSGGIILIILAALVILLSLLTSAFYGVYHSHRVVRASSPWFMHVSCLGTALAALSVIISLSPITDGMCAAQYWTLAIGFGLTFGSLFAKTYRLYRIFNQRQIQVVAISNWQVLSIVMGVAAVEILILIIFQADSPLTVSGTLMNDEQAWSYALQCSSLRGSSYAAALFAFNLLILLKGAQLAFSLRHIDGTFNETKYLGMAIYNTVIITCIVLPLVYIFRDTYPTFVLAFRSIFILYCAAFVLLVVTIPKYLAIQRASIRKNVGKASTRSGAGTGKSSNNTSHASSADSSQQTTTTDDNLPKIRTGDLASRTQILQELMSDMSEHRKLARLDRHLANANLHVVELEKLREQLQAQTAKSKSRSRINHDAATERDRDRDRSRKNTEDHLTTATTANTMASNGLSSTTDYAAQREVSNMMFPNAKSLPLTATAPRSSTSNFTAMESLSRAPSTSRNPPPIPIPIPSYAYTGSTSPTSSRDRDMQATSTSTSGLQYGPSSSSFSTAPHRSSGVEMHSTVTNHTGSLSTNASHMQPPGHSKNRI